MSIQASLLLALSGLLFGSPPSSTEALTKIDVVNTQNRVRPEGAVTFAMVFPPGEANSSITIPGFPTQVDVKRRFRDGSIKHAVLTVALGEMRPKGTVTLSLHASGENESKTQEPPTPTAIPKPDAVVWFVVHGGPKVSARLSTAKPVGSPWLYGQNVWEQEFVTRALDSQGQEFPDLEVRFHLRHYPASGSTRLSLIVENCDWTSPGNIPYNVAIRIDGKTRYVRQNVGEWPNKAWIGHAKGTRWIERFWIGRPHDDVFVRYIPEDLVRTGLLPHYDTRLKIDPMSRRKGYQQYRTSPHEILQPGLVTPYFPTTGGRPEIGPLPLWASRDILSQDPQQREITFGQGERSGSCPVHRRDPQTGGLLSIDDYPTFSLNPRGSRIKAPLRSTEKTPWILPEKSHFTIDDAHQPSLAYLPYLLSGDRYYFEEMAFWAAHNMLAINHAYRGDAKGWLTPQQIRGIAWTLRNLIHVAALAPDDSPEKAYFEEKLRQNFARMEELLFDQGTNLGVHVQGSSHAYTRGWPVEGGWRQRYYSYPFWQHNFLAWTFSHAVDQGYLGARRSRDFLFKGTVGIFTHPRQITPHAGSSYYVFVGERGEGGAPQWVQSWKDVHELTYLGPRPPGVKRRPPPNKTSGDYANIARGVLLEAMRANTDGAMEAYAWLQGHCQRSVGFFTRDPTWAFALPKRRSAPK